MKQFVGYLIKKAMGKGQVSPTIKSVKPNLKKTVSQTKSDEYSKRIKSLSDSEDKIKTGKKMMQEGQRARKKMVDTGRAFQFKSSTSYHPLGPGDKEKYGKQMKKPKKEKRVYSGKELEQQEYFKYKKRDKKMGGGMMGRRFGMKSGTPFKKKTNVEKIKETFAPKGLKKIDPEKQKGLAKLKKARPDVVRKMGYMKKGGRA